MNPQELRRLTEQRQREQSQRANRAYLAEKKRQRDLWLPKALELFKHFQNDATAAANNGECQVQYSEKRYQAPMLEVFQELCNQEGFTTYWKVDKTHRVADHGWRVLFITW